MKKIKKIIALLVLGLSFIQVKAQIQADPAHWAYGLKKLSGNTYEVHLQCIIDNGWHIYAQKQTKNFIGTATKITFEKLTSLTVLGTPIEKGKKETYTVKEVGITNYEYAGEVDFMQKAIIKPGTKEIKGTVTYQTCTHERCLPEKAVSFTVRTTM